MSAKANSLVKAPQDTIQVYGEESDLQLMVDRLMAVHPQARKLGVEVMRTVAQIAILSGANPLPTAGEIYCWEDPRTQGVQVYLGIKYYRRKAREKDMVIWTLGNAPRPMTEQERKFYDVPTDAKASICEGYLKSEIEALLPLIEAGLMSPIEARDSVARKGIGFVTIDNMVRKRRDGSGTYNVPPPNGRSWSWVATKRAEMDILSLFSLIDVMGSTDNAQDAMSHIKPRQWDIDIDPSEFNEIAFDAAPEGFGDGVIVDAQVVKKADEENLNKDLKIMIPKTGDYGLGHLHAVIGRLFGHEKIASLARKDLVISHSGGRTESSKELYKPEAKSLIEEVEQEFKNLYSANDETVLLNHLLSISAHWTDTNDQEDVEFGDVAEFVHTMLDEIGEVHQAFYHTDAIIKAFTQCLVKGQIPISEETTGLALDIYNRRFQKLWNS